MGAMASQITSLITVFSTVNSGTDQRRHQSSASLVFVRGIHRWPVNSPHKWPLTWKMYPFHDVIMYSHRSYISPRPRHSRPKYIHAHTQVWKIPPFCWFWTTKTPPFSTKIFHFEVQWNTPFSSKTRLFFSLYKIKHPFLYVCDTQDISYVMMTSSNGNIYRVTGHLCGEFTGLRWIPRTKASDAELYDVFFDMRLNKRLSKQSWGWWFERLSRPLWRHCNGSSYFSLHLIYAQMRTTSTEGLHALAK